MSSDKRPYSRHRKHEPSTVVDDDSELIALNEDMSLFLKDVSKITLTVQLPKVKLPGQCISTTEVMERLKKKAKPHSFKTLTVINNTLEFIRFEAEFDSKIVMDLVMSKLNRLLLKTSSFQDGLKIKCEKVKIGSSKHEWESYFRDNPKMDEKKPGYRPDTVHLKNLPLKWFGGSRPSTSMLLDAFKTFGEIKRFHIPLVDEMELMALNNSFQKFTHSDTLTFEAFIMFKDYVGFVKAMESLKGKKLVVKRGHYSPLEFDITIDFDKTKHLSDKAIKKRKLDKEYGIQNSEEVKQLKEETKKQRAAYEERISQLSHRKNQAKSLLQLILTRVSQREEESEVQRKQRMQELKEVVDRQRKQQEKRLQEEEGDEESKERKLKEEEQEKNLSTQQEIEGKEGRHEEQEEEVSKRKESLSRKEDRVSGEQKVETSSSSNTVNIKSNTTTTAESKDSSSLVSKSGVRRKVSMRSLVSTVRVSSRAISDEEDESEGRDYKASLGLRSVIQTKQPHADEPYDDEKSQEDYPVRRLPSHYSNGDVRRRDVDRLPLPPGVYEYRPTSRDHHRVYHEDDRYYESYRREEDRRSREYYRDERRDREYYSHRSSLRELFDHEAARHSCRHHADTERKNKSRSLEELDEKRERTRHDSHSSSIPSSSVSEDQRELSVPPQDSTAGDKEQSQSREEVSEEVPSKKEEPEETSSRACKRARITYESDCSTLLKRHKVISVASSLPKPRLLITTTNDRVVSSQTEDSKRQRIIVKVHQHLQSIEQK